MGAPHPLRLAHAHCVLPGVESRVRARAPPWGNFLSRPPPPGGYGSPGRCGARAGPGWCRTRREVCRASAPGEVDLGTRGDGVGWGGAGRRPPRGMGFPGVAAPALSAALLLRSSGRTPAPTPQPGARGPGPAGSARLTDLACFPEPRAPPRSAPARPQPRRRNLTPEVTLSPRTPPRAPAACSPRRPGDSTPVSGRFSPPRAPQRAPSAGSVAAGTVCSLRSRCLFPAAARGGSESEPPARSRRPWPRDAAWMPPGVEAFPSARRTFAAALVRVLPRSLGSGSPGSSGSSGGPAASPPRTTLRSRPRRGALSQRPADSAPSLLPAPGSGHPALERPGVCPPTRPSPHLNVPRGWGTGHTHSCSPGAGAGPPDTE